MSGKCNKKLLDYSKQCATVASKTASKRAIQKVEEAAANFIGNKIVNKITKVSKKFPSK